MTMTFMDGVKISKQDALKTLGLDPYDVATKLVKVFYNALHRPLSSTPIRIREISSCSAVRKVRRASWCSNLGLGDRSARQPADGMFDILSG